MDIQNLFKNEEFVKGLLDKNSAEEAQEYFANNGVELTLAEVQGLGEAIKKVAAGEISKEDMEAAANGELSESDLENVAGGFGVTLTALAIIAGVGGAVGSSVGILSVVQGWRW